MMKGEVTALEHWDLEPISPENSFIERAFKDATSEYGKSLFN